jgi:eukaryotic-like serine/threonine-protein kinase
MQAAVEAGNARIFISVCYRIIQERYNKGWKGIKMTNPAWPNQPAGGRRGVKPVYIISGLLVTFVCLCACVIAILLIILWQKGLAPSAISPTATNMPTRIVRPTSTSTKIPTPTIYLTPTFGIGSKWQRPKDRMIMLYVPAAEFSMGSDDGDPNELPPHDVALDDFWIDQTEVTNAMFQTFVDSAGYRTDAEKIGVSLVYQPGQYIPAIDKWKSEGGANWLHPHGPSTDLDGLENHPVVQVSWNDAYAYCKWAGARLPTEAEWELAARGTDGRAYPWGNRWPDGTLLNFGDSNLDAIWASSGVDDGYKFTAPVGNYPAGASPYGALDMAGNASEWVNDLYKYDYYYESTHSNPTGPASGILRVIRGGHWSFTAEGVRSAARLSGSPTYSIDYSGFRCARTP